MLEIYGSVVPGRYGRYHGTYYRPLRPSSPLQGALNRVRGRYTIHNPAVVSDLDIEGLEKPRRTFLSLEITKGSERDLVISESITSSTS